MCCPSHGGSSVGRTEAVLAAAGGGQPSVFSTNKQTNFCTFSGRVISARLAHIHPLFCIPWGMFCK